MAASQPSPHLNGLDSQRGHNALSAVFTVCFTIAPILLAFLWSRRRKISLQISRGDVTVAG